MLVVVVVVVVFSREGKTREPTPVFD